MAKTMRSLMPNLLPRQSEGGKVREDEGEQTLGGFLFHQPAGGEGPVRPKAPGSLLPFVPR